MANKDEQKYYEAEAEAAYQRYLAMKNAFTPEARAELDYCAQCKTISDAISRLEIGAEQLMQLRRAQEPIPSKLLVELRHILAIASMLDLPVIRVLALLVEFFLASSMAKYTAYKSALIKELPQIGVLRYLLYRQLTNTLFFIDFDGDSTEEYFALYKFGIEKDLIAENRTISFALFINVALYAFVLEEKEFLENFVKKYSPMIIGKSQQTHSKKLAECYISFLKGEYKKVRKELPKVKNITKGFTYKKRILELKAIYMEPKNKLDAFEKLEICKRGFWALNRRHKNAGILLEQDQTRTNKFINLVCRAAEISVTKDTKATLLIELEEAKDKVLNYRWLKKIIEQL